MLTPNSDLIRHSRQALSGLWADAILVMFVPTFVLQVVGFVVSLIAPEYSWIVTLNSFFLAPLLSFGVVLCCFSIIREGNFELRYLLAAFRDGNTAINVIGITILVAIGVVAMILAAVIVAAIIGLLIFLISGVNLLPLDDSNPEAKVVGVLVMFFVLFIAYIPALYFLFGFYFSVYVYADNPKLEIIDSMKRSFLLMDGHRWKFLRFSLRIVGLFFLSIFTLLVGLLWLLPLANVAITMFYEDIKRDYESRQQEYIDNPNSPSRSSAISENFDSEEPENTTANDDTNSDESRDEKSSNEEQNDDKDSDKNI